MEAYLKEALEIVRAQASVRTMTEEEISTMIKNLTLGIKGISEGSEVAEEAAAEEELTPIDPQKAIKEKSICCALCGKSFKILTKKHIATHGLSPEEYREKCGYKKGQPLVCKALQRERRNKMKEMELWKRRKSAK